MYWEKGNISIATLKSRDRMYSTRFWSCNHLKRRPFLHQQLDHVLSRMKTRRWASRALPSLNPPVFQLDQLAELLEKFEISSDDGQQCSDSFQWRCIWSKRHSIVSKTQWHITWLVTYPGDMVFTLMPSTASSWARFRANDQTKPFVPPYPERQWPGATCWVVWEQIMIILPFLHCCFNFSGDMLHCKESSCFLCQF